MARMMPLFYLNNGPSKQDQSGTLTAVLRGFKNAGHKFSKIVALAPLHDVSTTAPPWPHHVLRLANDRVVSPHQLHCSTIRAFKQLEAPTVTATYLGSTKTADSFGSLLHIGVNRTTKSLDTCIETDTFPHISGEIA